MRSWSCGAGDFPDVQRYREILEAYDLSSFPQVSKVRGARLMHSADRLVHGKPSCEWRDQLAARVWRHCAVIRAL